MSNFWAIFVTEKFCYQIINRDSRKIIGILSKLHLEQFFLQNEWSMNNSFNRLHSPIFGNSFNFFYFRKKANQLLELNSLTFLELKSKTRHFERRNVKVTCHPWLTEFLLFTSNTLVITDDLAIILIRWIGKPVFSLNINKQIQNEMQSLNDY